MILAAATFGEGKGPPPDELKLYLDCRRWRGLPRAGGILDQPAGLLERMEACRAAMQAAKAYQERTPGSDAGWKQTHPGEWSWIKRIRKLRNDGAKTRDSR